MRVAVLGAGAIGAYVGAALARGGTEVYLVARGEHLEALRRDGVRVLSNRGDFAAHPPATDDTSEIGPVDVVFLGLKANSYASAGPLLEPLMHEETAVVAGQNGIPWWYFHGMDGEYAGHRIESVDPGGAVSRVIPPERAIGCVVYAGTELEQPGVVRHLEGTRFTIGEPDGSTSARCRAFSEAMIAGGLKCPIEERVRDEIWVKLMGNVSFNPLSVLTRSTLAGMCRHQPTRRLVASMMEETLEIAHAVGAQPSVSIELTGVEAPCLRAVAAASGLLAESLNLT
jgi:2-dehydropantoate 2-reductase